MSKKLYQDNLSTGGHPPADCRSPLKKRAFDQLRKQEDQRAKKRQRLEEFATSATTGNRPPEYCWAPVRSGDGFGGASPIRPGASPRAVDSSNKT